MDIVKEIDITKYSNGITENIIDKIIVEEALDIYINNKYYVTLMCTPYEEKELVLGFLFSEGIISSIKEVENIEKKSESMIFVSLHDSKHRVFKNKRAITSGCGRGSIHVNILVNKNVDIIKNTCNYKIKDILMYMKEFNTSSNLFKETGGVHGCCICANEGLLISSEDIGRHNALDKLIGKSLLNNIDLHDKILLTTGRVSSDILIKTAKAKIPILVSHSAPTEFAVKMAKIVNITLVGFARGNRMNIYSGEHRLIY